MILWVWDCFKNLSFYHYRMIIVTIFVPVILTVVVTYFAVDYLLEAISLNKWCGHLCWPASSDFFAEHEHTRWYSFTPPQWPNMPPPLTCAGNRH